MGGIGPVQLLIVLLIVLLVFGTKKLRNLGSDLGGAVKGFKSSMKEGSSDEGDAPESAPEKLEATDGAAVDRDAVSKERDRA